MKTRILPLRHFSLPALSLVLLPVAASLHAADFTWDGSLNTWPSVHWLDNSSMLVAGGAGAAITDTYTINSGSVFFTDHDTFGNAAVNPLLTINVNSGGILSNEPAAFGMAFTTVGLLNLNNGTVTSTGGANANFQAFQFKNTVTSTGNSLINTTALPAAFNGFHVTNNQFNVTSGTLTVTAPLINAAGGTAAGFTKLGAGTMSLTAANGFTGNMIGAGGNLEVAAAGTVPGAFAVNTRSGGTLTVAGTVTVANAGSFGVGAGVTGTTGTVAINPGGVLNIGNGGGFTGIGGRDATGTGLGNGTLTVAGGTLNVAPAGNGTSGAGLDATNFWMNPYGTGGGTSTVNLDSGLLSTARTFANGSGSSTIFNLNGGTLRSAAGFTGSFFSGLSRVNIRNAGAVIDTNGNNNLLTAALLHSNIGGDNATDGGLTKSGSGTLTLTGAANGGTFTGNVTISAGTLTLQTNLNGAAPAGTGLGNPNTPGRTVTVNPGATLQFRNHDQLGNDVANPQMSILVNGGTLEAATGSQASGNGPFNTLPAVTLNGGTLTSANGAFPAVQSFSLKGDITVTGSTPSTINTTGTPALLNGIHLSKAGGVNFNVADVTGSSAADLTVSAPLISGAVGGINAGPGLLIKSGPGTMTLTSANTFTGATTIQQGTLVLAGSGALASTLIDVQSGAAFDISSTPYTLGSGQTIQVNGLLTGELTAAPGSVVTGSGVIDGTLILNGQLAPGNSPGILSLDGNDLMMGSASTALFELGGTTPGSFDRVMNISDFALDGAWTVSFTGGFTPAPGDSFDLWDASNVDSSGFTLPGDLFLPPLLAGSVWDASAFPTTGVISVVPEPGVAAFGLFTGAALLRRRRR
jgi:autotransporter-associated beta strand protein